MTVIPTGNGSMGDGATTGQPAGAAPRVGGIFLAWILTVVEGVVVMVMILKKMVKMMMMAVKMMLMMMRRRRRRRNMGSCR
jgi:hypothetical protein